MSVILRCDNFDIQQIAESGQCFRIENITLNTWQVMAFDRALVVVKKQNNEHEFQCSQDEFTHIWRDYFDLDADYGSITKLVRNDAYLTAAVNYGNGIRILKQDLWETIISFVISQQNNISRIKSLISKLCAPYGLHFPTAAEILHYSVEDLQCLGFGYRAQYIHQISQAVYSGDFDLLKLQNMSYQTAISYLLKLHGVGIKVANCIALFALHKTEAFPIDVWIKRIIDTHYNGKFNYLSFGQNAGIIQQYMYFYERRLL